MCLEKKTLGTFELKFSVGKHHLGKKEALWNNLILMIAFSKGIWGMNVCE